MLQNKENYRDMMTQLRQHKDIIFATKENLNNNIHNYLHSVRSWRVCQGSW